MGAMDPLNARVSSPCVAASSTKPLFSVKALEWHFPTRWSLSQTHEWTDSHFAPTVALPQGALTGDQLRSRYLYRVLTERAALCSIPTLFGIALIDSDSVKGLKGWRLISFPRALLKLTLHNYGLKGLIIRSKNTWYKGLKGLTEVYNRFTRAHVYVARICTGYGQEITQTHTQITVEHFKNLPHLRLWEKKPQRLVTLLNIATQHKMASLSVCMPKLVSFTLFIITQQRCVPTAIGYCYGNCFRWV